MARLVGIYRANDQPDMEKRQAPLMIDNQLMMVMDLTQLGLLKACHEQRLRSKQVWDFMQKFMYLTEEEKRQAFKVDVKDVINILNESIPCVGCRRSVERLYYQLMEVGKVALYPMLVNTDSQLIMHESVLQKPTRLCSLITDENDRLTRLVEAQPRNKKSKRCQLHSWDVQKSRIVTPAWKDVWNVMNDKCKAEITLIDFSMLLNKLETYLKKHRFCQDCRTKVMKAYNLLVEELDPSKEKGFMPGLYLGIRRCLPGKHIHLPPNRVYIDSLINRAEPEIMGNRRDRHAKTMEIAQEEVLTCIGICIYDRIYRVFLRLREEEFTYQVLFAAGCKALVRSFETLVEQKRGITKLELLCDEITKEEIAKKQRMEMKKLKKKKKKERKMCDVRESCDDEDEENRCESCDMLQGNSCTCPEVKSSQADKLKILDMNKESQMKCQCEECGVGERREPKDNVNTAISCGGREDWPCEDRSNQDCGYGSEINLPCSGTNSSPEGSEDACSEGFCDHDGECGNEIRLPSRLNRLPGPSLEEMLQLAQDEIEEECPEIPEEEIQAFQARSRQVESKRLELRRVLRNRFAQLCNKAQTAQV